MVNSFPVKMREISRNQKSFLSSALHYVNVVEEDVMKKILIILFGVVAIATLLSTTARADFQVAYTGAVEQRPAVAYNSQTGKFLVAYAIQYDDGTGNKYYGVQCQLLNADGSKSGDVLYPFGDLGVIKGLGRPAIAYNKNQNIFFVAVAERLATYDHVIGRFLNGDGTNRIGPDFLFDNDSMTTPFYIDGDGTGPLHVVYNEILDEFLVAVQRNVLHLHYGNFVRCNTIAAQHISESGYSSVVELADLYTSGVNYHSIAHAPIAGTTPAGGRYLFADGDTNTLTLLDSQLNVVTPVPVDYGTAWGGEHHIDFAYGEVEGHSQFLVVFENFYNCAPHHQNESPCSGQTLWPGVWGIYVDPLITSYPNPPNHQPPFASFPISNNLESYPEVLDGQMVPRVSYNNDAKGFFIVWRETADLNPLNGEIRSHIRGAFVDYYVQTTDLSPDPINVIISDVTGPICTTGHWCPSAEDPDFPSVAAMNGYSAVVIWQQKYPPNPTDYDIWGDFFTASPSKPDLIETAVSDPPKEANAGSSFSVTDTVQNQGNAAAGASITSYYLALTPAGRSYPLTGSRSVPSLGIDATNTGTITVTIPTITPSGSFYLKACADDTNLVAESNESNNCIVSAGKVTVYAVPGTLSVTPVDGLTSSGTQGGPFTPSSKTYTLQNTGGSSISWTASNLQTWDSLSSTSGSLAAGASTTVTVSINSTANSLAGGSYSDRVAFTNTTNGNGNTTRPVSLTVIPTGGILSVTPADGLTSSGNQGGPFTPSSKSYTLKNTGTGSMNWTVSKTQIWTTLSSTSGTLAAGASTTVTVSINSGANSLTPGSYSDTVSFTNTTNGNGRDVL